VRIIISVLALLMLVISLTGCGSEPASVAAGKTPEQNIIATIGPDTGTKDKSDEVADVKNNSGAYTITYNFMPVSNDDYYQEVGLRLSDGIKKLYSTDSSIDKLTFIIDGETKDAYGNITWIPIVSFDTDRALYQKINWNNFDSGKLLDVSSNVKALK